MDNRSLAVFVVVLLTGAVPLVLSLFYIIDSLPPAQPGERLQRVAATSGVGIGVMVLAGVMALLLGQVATLSREIARLREQRGGAASEEPQDARARGTEQGQAEPGAATDGGGMSAFPES